MSQLNCKVCVATQAILQHILISDLLLNKNPVFNYSPHGVENPFVSVNLSTSIIIQKNRSLRNNSESTRAPFADFTQTWKTMNNWAQLPRFYQNFKSFKRTIMSYKSIQIYLILPSI